MARAIRSSTLHTRSARLKLPVSIKPTFIRVAKGLGLGYRRNKSGGVWVMRVADGKRGSWVRTIGAAGFTRARSGRWVGDQTERDNDLLVVTDAVTQIANRIQSKASSAVCLCCAEAC